MAFKCIYTFWILLLKSVPWIYIANKCGEYFACELNETAPVAELHQNMDWAVSEHPELRQILSRVQSDDSLTTSLPWALSDHTGQDWAACQVNPNKNQQKAETICCLWPLKYFAPESDIFLSGWQMLFLSPDSEHNARANVRAVIWNKSHVEISVWIPRCNILKVLSHSSVGKFWWRRYVLILLSTIAPEKGERLMFQVVWKRTQTIYPWFEFSPLSRHWHSSGDLRWSQVLSAHPGYQYTICWYTVGN